MSEPNRLELAGMSEETEETSEETSTEREMDAPRVDVEPVGNSPDLMGVAGPDTVPFAPPVAPARAATSLPAQMLAPRPFVVAQHPSAALTETTVYRPGLLIGAGFLALPALTALIGVGVTLWIHSVPVWLPLLLLLWIPVLGGGVALLRSVRLTPDAIAFGRPLQAWRVIPFDAIERVERRGPRLMIITTSGRSVSLTPALLRRGAQLQRRLLLSLPIQALVGAARVEAQRLIAGEAPGGETAAADVMTARPRRVWLALVGIIALACLAGSGAAALLASATQQAPLMIACALAALVALALEAWLAQEVFISDRGILVRYRLLRLQRSIAWGELSIIERAPGEVALFLRGARTVACAGPGLLDERRARQMRQWVSRYAISRGIPVAPRIRR